MFSFSLFVYEINCQFKKKIFYFVQKHTLVSYCISLPGLVTTLSIIIVDLFWLNFECKLIWLRLHMSLLRHIIQVYCFSNLDLFCVWILIQNIYFISYFNLHVTYFLRTMLDCIFEDHRTRYSIAYIRHNSAGTIHWY